jgi:hypothetical protein
MGIAALSAAFAERHAMSNELDPRTTKGSVPFPKRWIGYVVLKLVILSIAVLITLHLYGML